MDLIQAVLMGIVQGLSEFLPISSSGHLVITSNIYKVIKGIDIIQNSNQEVFLDIMLHFGTLIAVLIFFRKELIGIIQSLFYGIKNKDFSSYESKIGIYIIIGTIFTAIIAKILNNTACILVFKPEIVGILLVLTGVLLFTSAIVEKKYKNKKDLDIKSAILIGIAQGIATLPGLSRSGLTIATGLMMGQDREKTARYSFLLSIPIILGASMIYPITELNFSEMASYRWTAILIGTIVSGIVGYLCIKYFLKFVAKYTLKAFGYYCFIMGIISTIFFSIF